MGLANTLKNETLSLGILVMIVVILSVILLKMRISDSVACQTGVYNATPGTAVCCLNGTNVATGAGNAMCAANESLRSLFTDVGTYVTAFSEPKNWVIIIIIGLIAIGLIKLFTSLGKSGGD